LNSFPCLAISIGNWESVPVKAYEEVAEFIARRGPREVSEFKPSAEARQRAAELLQREKTTGLTPDERRELDHYEDLELLMNLAKARARQLLTHEQ
jgi:hypothetical protein